MIWIEDDDGGMVNADYIVRLYASKAARKDPDGEGRIMAILDGGYLQCVAKCDDFADARRKLMILVEKMRAQGQGLIQLGGGKDCTVRYF